MAKAAGIEAEKPFDRPSSSRRFGRVGPTTPEQLRSIRLRQAGLGKADEIS
jgi:hypothetical protein